MKKQIILGVFIFIYVNSYSQYPGDTTNWDTIKFESAYEYLNIDTSNQNIWQIGRPSKIFFDSAYSKEKAIVTDSINFYPVNNCSYFNLYLGLFNCPFAFPCDFYIGLEALFINFSLFSTFR